MGRFVNQRAASQGLAILLVAAVYVGAAKLGLSVAHPGAPQVTPVWPPTGIALAVIVLLGYRVWPGVWLGAFVANVTTPGETLFTACGIAVGNTLEAVVGAVLLIHLFAFHRSLERLKDVLGLLAVIPVCTAISATLGVASLFVLAPGQPGDSFGGLWLLWWVGDMMGAILVAPVLLTWAVRLRSHLPRAARIAEAVVLVAAQAVTCWLVLVELHPWFTRDQILAWVVLPFTIWAALRFGPRLTTAVTLTTAAIAVWATSHGFGPFNGDSLQQSLVLLFPFLTVLAVAGLFLGAAVSERNMGARRRAVNYAVNEILADGSSLCEVTPQILRAIGESLSWDIGALWEVDNELEALRCVEFWRGLRVEAPEFETVSRNSLFAPGVGLPGRVWESLKPLWVADLTRETASPRAEQAAAARLHAAFAFPVRVGGEVLAVMEFFSREVRQPDAALLQSLATVGSQIGLFMDRKRTEVGRYRLGALVESSDDAIVSKDLSGVVTSWNKAAERIFGYCAAEMIGRPINILTVEGCADEMDAILERIKCGERIEQYETFLRGKDGRRIAVSLTVSPIRDVVGRLVGISKIARDITGRKRMEQELARQAKKLAEADRRKDEFLAMLAHELRNPIAPLRNGLNILRVNRHNEAENERIQEMMERQVRLLARLVDDLLEVSRITRGKIELRKERIDLAAVVHDAVETSRPLIEQSNHHLTVVLPAEPLVMDADPVRLAQVLANLLNNAAKYTDIGGQISISGRREGDEVVLRVRDTGVGIPLAMLPDVFEMFTQVDRSVGRSQGGLGIGLGLVRMLVKMHGGTVTASSDGPGKGSEFVVRLPLAAEGLRSAEARQRPPPEPAQLTKGKVHHDILVVDDNRDSAETMGKLLAMQGNRVQIAYDGPSALKIADDCKPSVVLMDIGMPGMDGYQVAREIRRRRELEGVTLIALTGWGQDEDRQMSREAGFDHHLIKPVEIDALEALLDSLEPAVIGQ